jgi:hypothetical protein
VDFASVFPGEPWNLLTSLIKAEVYFRDASHLTAKIKTATDRVADSAELGPQSSGFFISSVVSHMLR